MGLLKNMRRGAAEKPKSPGAVDEPKSDDKLDALSEIYGTQEGGFSGKNDDTILSLDIGTEYVKAIIAKQNKRGELDVVGVGRARPGASNN